MINCRKKTNHVKLVPDGNLSGCQKQAIAVLRSRRKVKKNAYYINKPIRHCTTVSFM